MSAKHQDLTAAEVAQLLAERVDSVVPMLLPGAVVKGNEYVAGDISGGPGKSLGIVIAGPKAGSFIDRANPEHRGDLLTLWQLTRNVDMPTAIREALDYLGIGSMPDFTDRPRPTPKQEIPRAPFTPPQIDDGELAEVRAVAVSRKLTTWQGLESLIKRGQLGFTSVYDAGEEHRCWILFDHEAENYQARKIDGSHFEGIKCKTKTLPGSSSKIPIGVSRITESTTKIYVVEGPPDAIAAATLHCHDPKGWEILCITGASNGLEHVVPEKLAGRHITIYADNDQAGLRAAQVWAATCVEAKAATVEILTPEAEGADLNDAVSMMGEDSEPALKSVMVAAASRGWLPPRPLPDELPPVAAFDVNALPDSLRPFVEDSARRLGCPIEFCAAAAMVAAGACIGRSVALAPKTSDGWREFPNLWSAAIGLPSSMKSPAIAEMLQPLNQLDESERIGWNDAFLRWKNEHALWKRELKVAEQNVSKAFRAGVMPGEDAFPVEPEKPPMPRIVLNDCTTEKLVEIAAENPRGLLLSKDELSGWLASFRKSGREGDRAFYLEAASGKNSVKVDRIGRGTTFCSPIALSIIGSIQPGPISDLVTTAEGGALDDGLLQRFGLLVWPDAPPGPYRVCDTRPDEDARRLYAETLIRLRDVDGGELAEPGIMRYSNEARDEWKSWLEAEVNEIRNEGGGPLNSHRMKLAGKTLHGLALICQFCDDPQEGFVGIKALNRAISWVEILKTHAARLYAPATSPRVKATAVLGSKIKTGKVASPFKIRDIYRNNWADLSDPDICRQSVETLVSINWIRAKESPDGPGRPSEEFELNPMIA